ncbi:DNA polymerase III subunit delta [Pigmentiphaga sp.]|uniref:DNA polymerase III subunit delta n=1 Tax=Pigmentiphaga sp. TaxID=1977564 RepID=UPI00128B4197|nr:DNA polymerase III subunit delta [Pigmentiphaga sp.]MPS26792.1 DNA polymerase III subunit delta [Alcaligenaceae bacterium SAGV5]MPS53817.1 DNA polymerase III subunit delta [Alcaligenaceae bacterium SAGV3]MPT60251.1 DNA polymerase III subunit delta [Alcaligenaceae bacterium]
MRQLRPEQLIAQLQRAGEQLEPLYTVTGDEPLLVIEACDALRTAATTGGFTERETVVADARSDWNALLSASQSISLFGDRRLLELKIPTGKPGKTGGEVIARLARQAPGQQGDSVTVVMLPKLDKTTRASAWFSALAEHGIVIDVPTIERPMLPGWVGERLARQKQRAGAEVLQWLADRVEGNLLAAHQEILKLGLLYPEGALTLEQVHDAVMNVARYDVFKLRDAMLAGDAQRMVRLIEGLRAEGEALPLVLWAVGEEIRLLARLAQAGQQGQSVPALMRTLRFFGTHEQLANQALKRLPPQAWTAAVHHAHEVDKIIKGLRVPGRLPDPWHEITRLALRLAA